MTRKEQTRVKLLNEVNEGVLTAGEAAGLLGVSLRQVRRLLAAYRTEGVAAIAHGNRGRCRAHRIDAATRRQVRALAGSSYAGCNQHHLPNLPDESVQGRSQWRLHRCSFQRVWQHRRERDWTNFIVRLPSPYGYMMHSVFIATAKHVFTNKLDIHPYVNTGFGPMSEISRPEAKNDWSMLTRQRRQWDT